MSSGPYLVQLASGRYRLAMTLASALELARQVARSSGRPAPVREASLSPGSTILYVQPSGEARRA
jgi:hypothetical protein